MSQRLLRMMEEKVLRDGSQGRLEMALSIGRGERMIDRYMKGTSLPSPSHAHKLAKACGCNDEEALEIARECSQEKGADSA